MPPFTIRPLRDSDYSVLHSLYLEQTSALPHLPKVRARQFREHLLTSRLFQDPKHFDPEAEIALVVERSDGVVAFASGGLLRHGDYVVGSNFGCLRTVFAQKGCRAEARAVIRAVTDHIEAAEPGHVEAFNSCLAPMFTGEAAGYLSTQLGWLGQCLVDEGFEIKEKTFRMVTDLKDCPTDAPLPNGFRVEQMDTRVKGEVAGLSPEYNVGYMLMEGDSEAGWCGNFYSGAFLRGSGKRYFHTHWFTIFEAYRGRNLGRKLLAWSLAQAKLQGARKAGLWTHIDNFIAHEVYRSLGYRIVDTGYSFSKPCLFRHSQALKAMQEADSRRLETILLHNPGLTAARIPEHDKQPTLLHKLSEIPRDDRPLIASTLLKHGAAVDATDVDPRGPRALREAILSNHLELVRVLLDHGANPGPHHEPDGRSPLSLALLCGHTEIAKSLVKYGAEPSPAESAGLGHLPNEDLVRALSFAAINNQSKTVKKLLERGVDPNLKPLEMGSMICTPLHRACSEGHQAVVEVLLEHGADPEVTDDVYDATPLIWARYNERPDIAELLENLTGDV